MADYPLTTLGARFTVSLKGERIGLTIPCPNCGMLGDVYFDDTDWRETLTLHPSVKMFGHFHSWIRNGMLCVDSPFECTKVEEPEQP